MKRFLLSGCMIILFTVLLAACRRSDNSDPVVARVNGIDITVSQMYFHIPFVEERMEWEYFIQYGEWDINPAMEYEPGITFGRAIRENAVREAAFLIIVNDYARRLGIELTALDHAMIEGEIERMREQLGRQEFERMMTSNGFREERNLTEFFEAQILTENLVSFILANPAEFLPFAPHMPEEEVIPELFGAKHILAHFAQFDSEAEAEEFAAGILARALLGEDFDDLMFTYTQDPGIMDFPMGYSFASGDMMLEFEQGTRDLAMGGISGLVRTDFGIHIIKRIEPNAADWYRLHQRQPRSEENRMLEAIYIGFTLMTEEADIVFLAALDDI
ncbi:MAG: peptidylprolyl isomerase [Defluviitaleaceae bacterium]|nr:peptidylprolyl isomerase [Defluviitaleaceae bacterium]